MQQRVVKYLGLKKSAVFDKEDSVAGETKRCRWVSTKNVKKCSCKQGRRNRGEYKKPLWLYKNNKQTNKMSEYLK